MLVTAGCELCIRDARGRMARDVAQRRANKKELLDLLDSTIQTNLMQQKARRARSFEIIRYWNLLQDGRAVVTADYDHLAMGIHEVQPLFSHRPTNYASLPHGDSKHSGSFASHGTAS